MVIDALMTGDSMKSDLFGTERLRIESRQSLSRRNMSKSIAVLNGDHAVDNGSMVNLAAAFHDHISCTKSSDLCQVQDSSSERMTLPCETDHIYANCSDAKGPSSKGDVEMQKLKEIVVLHTDLIQHQQEQILKRERQLRELKDERDSLRQKLERLEKKLAQSSRDTTVRRPSLAVAATQTELRLGTGHTSPVLAVSRQRSRPSSSSRGHRKRARSSDSGTTRSVRASSAESSTRERVGAARGAATATTRGPSPPPRQPPVKRRPVEAPQLDSSLLWTSTPYHCFVGQTSPATVSQEETEEKIEVPTWRLHPVASGYSMEGTENLDDEVFGKRHQKLELDERRRKRWDIQRLREQRRTERLLQKQRAAAEGPGQNSGSPLTSFFFNPKNVHYIEVTDALPVVAFGHPVPSFQPEEFSLPWFDTSERERREQSNKVGRRLSKTHGSGHRR